MLIFTEDRSEQTLWLFNIRPTNWDRCVNGPPDHDIHEGYRTEPWHGLSNNVAWKADEIQEGNTELVRQSEYGVMGIWEIDETVPVTTQKHHNWEGKPTYRGWSFDGLLSRPVSHRDRAANGRRTVALGSWTEEKVGTREA